MTMKRKDSNEAEIFTGENVMSFTFDGAKVVLPILDGYKPGKEDDNVVYKETRPDGKEDTFYSFNIVRLDENDNDMGGMRALYQVSPDGSMNIKINTYDEEGKEVIRTSNYEMNKDNVKKMNKYVDSGKLNYKPVNRDDIPDKGMMKIVYNCGKENVGSKSKVKVPMERMGALIRRVR